MQEDVVGLEVAVGPTSAQGVRLPGARCCYREPYGARLLPRGGLARTFDPVAPEGAPPEGTAGRDSLPVDLTAPT